MTEQDDELVADLLARWEELREHGHDAPAGELAGDHPHLVDELARRIAALKATSWLDTPLPDDFPDDSPSGPAVPPPAGPRTLAGRYRLDAQVAEGGFARVWRAFDLELQRTVAVKVPRPGRLRSADAFLAEARRVARLKHPGIVPVFDVGRDGDACFIVAEFVEGGSLADRLVGGPPPRADAVRWAAEVADALAFAHRHGVVHRDVKPANVLIDHHGRALLADFGVARSAAEHDAPAPPTGTLRYMSPEQLGGREVDARTDVYSLGVVTYELVTGRLPYSSADPAVLRREVAAGVTAATLAGLAAGPRRVCRRALHRDPQRRHPSAAHLAADLRRTSAGGRSAGRTLAAVLPTLLILAGGAAFWGPSAVRWLSAPAEDTGEIRRFDTPGSQMTAVAFSPDGRFVLTGELSRQAGLWDVETGDFVRRFEGHADWVRAVAFSSDGRWVVTGTGGTDDEGRLVVGRDNSVRVWDAGTGRLVRRLGPVGYPVASVAVSPDGAEVLSGSDDGTVRLWDRETGEERLCVRGHLLATRSVRFVPGRRWAVSGGADSTIRLWDLDGGRELRRFYGHRATVEAVACTADGKWLASGAKDDTVRVWDVESGREVRRWSGHTGHVTSVGFSPDGRGVVSGGLDGTIRLWDVATGRAGRVFPGHKQGVLGVAVSPDGRTAVSGGADGVARLWALPGWEAAEFVAAAPPPAPPADTRELFALGMRDFERTYYHWASERFAQVVTHEPDNARAVALLGRCKSLQGDHGGGVADLDRAVGLAPADADFRRYRAEAGGALRRFDPAVADAEEALRLNPADSTPVRDLLARLYSGRAADHAGAGRLAEAAADVTEALRHAPEAADLYHRRGTYYFGLKRYEAAAADFTVAAGREPAQAAHYLHRGRCLEAMGRAGEAAADFGRAEALGRK